MNSAWYKIGVQQVFAEQKNGYPGHSGVKKTSKIWLVSTSSPSGSLDFSSQVPVWVRLSELSSSSPILSSSLSNVLLYVEFLITNLFFHFQKLYVDLSQNCPVNWIFHNLFFISLYNLDGLYILYLTIPIPAVFWFDPTVAVSADTPPLMVVCVLVLSHFCLGVYVPLSVGTFWDLCWSVFLHRRLEFTSMISAPQW